MSVDLCFLHSEASLGHAWLTLGHDLFASLLGLNLGRIVGLDAVKELLTAAGGQTCSTRTCTRLAAIRPPIFLFTITPTAWGVTLNTRPVRPWQNLWGMPFWIAELALMSTSSPNL